MPADSNNDTTDHNPTNDQSQAIPDSSHSEVDSDWSTPLWDDVWEGETGLFGDVRLCVATKKWGDGTVDVLVAHDPYAEDGMPTAYAHRHGKWVTPLAVHGLADDVVKTVTNVWGSPQSKQTSGDS
jgi:hypothetical protein